MPSKFNQLVKGEPHWHDKVNQIVNDLNEELQFGKNSVTLSNEKNSKIDTSSLVKASIPNIKIEGRTLANLMGNRGDAVHGQGNQFTFTNCSMQVENVAQSDFRYALRVNSGAIGIMNTSEINEVNRLLKVDKYYIAIAEVIAPEASDMDITIMDSVSIATGTIETGGTNKLIYNVIKVSGTSPYLDIRIANGTSGITLTANVGKIRIYNINESEVSNIENDLVDVSVLYPYVDNVQSVVNPYLTAVENLLAYTNYCVGGIYAGGAMQGNTGSADIVSTENISLKSGVNYTLSLENNTGIDLLKELTVYARVCNKNDTNYTLEELNTMESEYITISTDMDEKDNIFRVYIYFDNGTDEEKLELSAIIMEALRDGSIKFVLTETDYPVKSDMCHDSRIVFDTTLHNDEMLYPIPGGEYIKKNLWNEVEVTHKQPFSIYRGFKGYITLIFTDIHYEFNSARESNPNKDSIFLVRYDGTIVPHTEESAEWYEYIENFHFGFQQDVNNSENYLGLKVPNELSGWAEDYTPTEAEVRAFLLGWKMYAAKTNDDRNEWSDTLTSSGHVKGWLKLYCGIGAYSVLENKTPFIGGSNMYTCPTVNDINKDGFKPYKVIYKRLTPSYDCVNNVGVLAVSDKTTVKVQSGLVLNERYKVKYNGYETGLSHFNPGYDAVLDTPKYRVGNILKLLYNEKILRYALHLGLGDAVKYNITNGLSEAVIDADLLGEDIFATYTIYPNNVVAAYDLALEVSETTHDDVKKLIGKTTNLMEVLDRTKNELEFMKYRHSDNVYHPNLLINGDFQVWQRGESFDRDLLTDNSLMYTADRWQVYRSTSSTNMTRMLVSKTENGMKLVIKGSGQARLVQTLECPKSLWGKDVTFSAKCDKPVELIIGFRDDIKPTYGPGYNMGSKKSSASSVTYNVPYGAKSISVSFNLIQTEDTTYNIEWTKLEVGTYTTQFVPKSYAEELRDCEYFYQEIQGIFQLSTIAADQFNIGMSYDNMRVTVPTLSFKSNVFNTDSSVCIMREDTTIVDGASFSLVNSNMKNNLVCAATKTAHGVTGKASVTLRVGPENPICIDAEIY